MLIIYDNEFSSCATKVRLTLAEKACPWTRLRIDIAAFEQKTPDYLRINPNGVVPSAVVDEGIPLIESHIIMQFIDNLSADAPLSPQAPADRARMQMWLRLIDDAHAAASAIVASEVFIPLWRSLSPGELDARLACFADAQAAARLRKIIATGLGSDQLDRSKEALRQFFRRVEEVLGTRRWLLGPADADYSLADIALTPYVASPLRAIADIWLTDCPHLRRWLDSVRERPSYQEAVSAYPNSPDVEEAIRAAPSGDGRVLLG